MPNVSLCTQENEVHYNPWVEPPFFCKLTLNDDSVVEIEGSGELTSAMTEEYSATCVSLETGELCTSIGADVFHNKKSGGGSLSLTSVTLSDSITEVGVEAFWNCQNLSNLELGNGLVSIKTYAFYGCDTLTSLDIPDSVTFIGEQAFYACGDLTAITIGSGITEIANWGFGNANDLETIICKAPTAPTIGSGTFYSVKINGTLYVPQGSTGYEAWMDTGNYYLGKYNWTKVEQ